MWLRILLRKNFDYDKEGFIEEFILINPGSVLYERREMFVSAWRKYFFFKYLFINYTSMYVSIENICMHNFLADRKIMVVLLKSNTHIHTNTFLLCDEMGWRCE